MEENTLWQEELNVLANIVESTALKKTVKWGTPVYTYDGQNVLSLVGFKSHFAIWFPNGVFLQDRFKVLTNAQPGTTKAQRQWRFSSGDQIEEAKIRSYILEAIEVAKKGLSIKPVRQPIGDLPSILKDSFRLDEHLKQAFDKLSLGKRKEYITYLQDAKRDATKARRLEKIRPLILQGVGLNDAYK